MAPNVYESLRRTAKGIEASINPKLKPVPVLTDSVLFSPDKPPSSIRPYKQFFDIIQMRATRYGCEAIDHVTITHHAIEGGTRTQMTRELHAVEIRRGSLMDTDSFLNAVGLLHVDMKDQLSIRNFPRDLRKGMSGNTLAELLISARDALDVAYQKRTA